MTTPPFNPLPCGPGTSGASGADVEQNVLCEIDADGNLIGTALAVWTYDENGNPVGPPTFVDPVTGNPYTVTTGTLQVCPDGTSMGPVQFCQTGTSTAPVEHPGRQYDLTLPINPGFAVQSMQVDQVTNAANVVWNVDDPDGERFRQDLTAFMEGRLPSAAVVTITNPNAGTPQVCGAALPMQVHIECLRLDQSPPDLVELVYNGGQDMVQNPAYNEFPALNPPVSQGNYGFHLLARQDDPGPFPGNPPSGRVLCTSTANRGWETNDAGRTFEIWGRDITQGENVTPTPRGTPVQEITSDGPPGGGRSTIWQTFTAPASGNFIVRVVHGARDPGEQHRITLDNGDTGDAQNGDLIDNSTTPPSVTGSGGPNPWTQFSQTIPLNSGSTYTLSLSTTNPAGGARGGLFTDMRAYLDRPDLRATAATDDDTCTVTVTETSTTTVCHFWQPQSAGGHIVGWERLDTGLTLSNAAFWAQTPTPSCCGLDAAPGGDSGGTTNANLAVSDTVCVIIGGVPSNAIRVVVLDPSGGQLSETFLGPDGAPVSPGTWTAGPCTTNRTVFDVVLCDLGALDGEGRPTPFLRKFVQSLDAQLQGNINSHRDFTADGTGTYTVVGPVGDCSVVTPVASEFVLCDNFPPFAPTNKVSFVRRFVRDVTGAVVSVTDTALDGTPYTVQGGVADCLFNDLGPDRDRESACWTTTAGGATVFTGTIRHDDRLTGPTTPGWALFNQNVTPVPGDTPGLTFVPCGGTATATAQRDEEILVLCDSAAVPVRFLRRYNYDAATGALASVVNTTLDGSTPFAPTGAVGICTTPVATDFDFVVIDLCDGNGTAFNRRLTFNSSTGAVTSTTDTTLAGAAFVPVGAVGRCTTCCPAVIGSGCTNTGSGFYTAIRAANGTISLIDSVSGAAVTGANIVACPSDNTVKTLTAQARQLTNGAPWTPGADVVGTLTSLTVTGVSGLWDLVDQSGTALTGLPAGLTLSWDAEDDNTLTGPTSVTPQAGASVVAHWTQR